MKYIKTLKLLREWDFLSKNDAITGDTNNDANNGDTNNDAQNFGGLINAALSK